jgi:predicted nucleic acid-binding protein
LHGGTSRSRKITSGDPRRVRARRADSRRAEIWRRGDAAITSINLAETVDVASRVYGVDIEDVVEALQTPLVRGELRLIVPGRADAWRAAHFRVRYYSRREQPVSIADCFLLAAAGPGDRIATSDPAVAAVARAEGIELVALPDSSGRRP